MATIDSWNIVADVMCGKYAEDRPSSVTAYTNIHGKLTYGVCFERDRQDRYRESAFVKLPVMIWTPGRDGWFEDHAAAKHARDIRLLAAGQTPPGEGE